MQLRRRTLFSRLISLLPLPHLMALIIAASLFVFAVFMVDSSNDDVSFDIIVFDDYQSVVQGEQTDIDFSPAPNSVMLELTDVPVEVPDSPVQVSDSSVEVPDGLVATQDVSESAELADEEPQVIRYAIEDGDTLSTIFNKFNISQNTMYQVLAADEQVLALDIIRPGNYLTFLKDPQTSALLEMELFIHAGNRIIYRRVDDTMFEFEELIYPGVWEQETIAGEIHGSFYVSAINAGLSKAEIVEINKLMGEQINFSRQIRAGDRFQVVRRSQFVEGTPTGQTNIEAIRIQQNRRTYTAFLFEDGNYYDMKGESLTRAFRRLPHEQTFRISSSFNPTRLHPVTRRIAPHNGTDFAMPIGTPVLTIGDGVVTRVENHPFAGKYIEIQHGSTYKTRYLHLNRHLVKRGDTVKRGQRIALSGNTGRSTGPHLHFELHVNGRPVNAMKANLPMALSVPKKQLAKFNQQTKKWVGVMDTASQKRIATLQTTAPSGG